MTQKTFAWAFSAMEVPPRDAARFRDALATMARQANMCSGRAAAEDRTYAQFDDNICVSFNVGDGSGTLGELSIDWVREWSTASQSHDGSLIGVRISALNDAWLTLLLCLDVIIELAEYMSDRPDESDLNPQVVTDILVSCGINKKQPRAFGVAEGDEDKLHVAYPDGRTMTEEGKSAKMRKTALRSMIRDADEYPDDLHCYDNPDEDTDEALPPGMTLHDGMALTGGSL